MKSVRLLFACLASTALAAFAAESQDTYVLSYRVKAHPGRSTDLTEALKAHTQKFHTSGDVAWRLYRVMTGPDSGRIQITEGPSSLGAIGERGNLGSAHSDNNLATVTPLIADVGPRSVVRLLSDYSTAGFANSAKHVLHRSFYVKPGQSSRLLAALKLLKPAWEKTKASVVVYQTYYSGEARIVLARRLQNGLKDVSPTAQAELIAAYDSIHGAGAYDKMALSLEGMVEKIEDCILETLPLTAAK